MWTGLDGHIAGQKQRLKQRWESYTLGERELETERRQTNRDKETERQKDKREQRPQIDRNRDRDERDTDKRDN